MNYYITDEIIEEMIENELSALAESYEDYTDDSQYSDYNPFEITDEK